MSLERGPEPHPTDAALGQYPVSRWRDGRTEALSDWVAEEVPVALVYNGLSHAVMLCTPRDLEDFARGFSLSECIVERPEEIYDIQVQPRDEGIEVSLQIAQSRFWALKTQRRNLAGRTGCGLCGKESLEQLGHDLPPVAAGPGISAAALQTALGRIKPLQDLFNKTGSVHAAAWCNPAGAIECLREDVGRHNALDKLLGQRLAAGQPSTPGLVVMTSRASYEIVQKAAACGVTIIAALSGTTGLAVRLADQLGVTLIGFARDSRLSIYTHPERIL
ncbi:formate dehydrogenase accessory sulfurtransferase FdhD [Motiliproteus sp. SC1-56]|uniref:formate dehydrogenase accessory sulfurtransferase FdhD n=1 Tax=Motiliproteus sp. SC1-56 TaxID=2799565 RepID=UPI001A8E1877|nr:formate dehydrogenase accessory sulfurtransferase FdhD [Motiliproteus sp. SC1-56]